MYNAVTFRVETPYVRMCNALPDPTRPDPNYLTTRVEAFHHDVALATRATREDSATTGATHLGRARDEMMTRSAREVAAE